MARLWQRKYERVFDSIDDAEPKEQFLCEIDNVAESPINCVTLLELSEIVAQLPSNKAVGRDQIPAEVFKHAPMYPLTWLSVFFTSFLTHSFLPAQLSDVILVPLLKNKMKDPNDSTNYRPIALATAASKMFERVLLNRLNDFLYNSDNQFGFKPQHSTELCIFAVKEVINYYLHLNTPIFLCFIDLKSAFDRVSYWLLLRKLLSRGVPLYLLLILQCWFREQRIFIRWGASLSAPFNMNNGIRQGSVISPLFFSVYVHDLNIRLNESRIGCHVSNVPVNNFAYADDFALVCPSATALNDMLRVCESFAADHYILFSTTKSVCLNITSPNCRIANPPAIYLCGQVLDYVTSFTYLGHVICSDFNDDEDIKKETRKLCARGNAIVRQFKPCNMDVKLTLFKSYCYSLYCGSLWTNYRVAVLNRLKVTYNNIMRRFAGVPTWHSARTMLLTYTLKVCQRDSCGKLTALESGLRRVLTDWWLR